MNSRTATSKGPLIVQRRVVKAALAAAALVVTAGCSSGGSGGGSATGGPDPSVSGPVTGSASSPRPTGTAAPAKGSVKVVRTVAEGLKSPWGLAPLPEGGLLVSSRDEGTITRVDEKTGRTTELGQVPGVAPAGEGGLLGIALSPTTPRTTWSTRT